MTGFGTFLFFVAVFASFGWACRVHRHANPLDQSDRAFAREHQFGEMRPLRVIDDNNWQGE